MEEEINVEDLPQKREFPDETKHDDATHQGYLADGVSASEE